tara:strand:+ start:346 stop:504 length:159 start_codon:yes stop_codon:yes gene_type:complete
MSYHFFLGDLVPVLDSWILGFSVDGFLDLTKSEIQEIKQLCVFFQAQSMTNF